MSGDIFLTIDTIVLHGLEHVDRHNLEVALQKYLQRYLALNHEFHAADAVRMQLQLNLPAASTAEHLGQALGERLGVAIAGSREFAGSMAENTSVLKVS